MVSVSDGYPRVEPKHVELFSRCVPSRGRCSFVSASPSAPVDSDLGLPAVLVSALQFQCQLRRSLTALRSFSRIIFFAVCSQFPRSQLVVCTGCMIHEYFLKECTKGPPGQPRQAVLRHPEVMSPDLPPDYVWYMHNHEFGWRSSRRREICGEEHKGFTNA